MSGSNFRAQAEAHLAERLNDTGRRRVELSYSWRNPESKFSRKQFAQALKSSNKKPIMLSHRYMPRYSRLRQRDAAQTLSCESSERMHYLQRRVKCDETHPYCIRCIKSGNRCEGYQKLKTWLFEPESSMRDEQSKTLTRQHMNAINCTGSLLFGSPTKTFWKRESSSRDSCPQAVFARGDDELICDHVSHQQKSCSACSEHLKEHHDFEQCDRSGPREHARSRKSPSRWIYYVEPAEGSTCADAISVECTLANAVPRQLTSSYADRLLAHANSCFWPQLLMISGQAESPVILNAWFNMITNSPMIFNANLYRFSKHLHEKRGMPPTREQALQGLHYQSLALRSTIAEVNRVFQTGSPPSDDLITTVLLLALCQKLSYRPKQHASVPEASLITASANGLAHLHALPILVRLKGGLDAIRMPGIADRIFLHDITVSTFLMRQPVYKMRQLHPILQGNTVTTLNNYTGADEIFKLLNVFADILDGDHWDSVPEPPSFTDIFLVRYQLQHYILSLPTSITRTTLLLLSDLYIMPLPLHVGHRQRLLNTLQAEIVKDGRNLNVVYEMWCLTVGGMGASSSMRAWFVQRVVELCQKQDLKEIASIITALSTIHWCHAAFATAQAKIFWGELANDLEASESFKNNDKLISKRIPTFADSCPLIQTLAVEYVL